MTRKNNWYTIRKGFYIEQIDGYLYRATAYANPTFKDTNLFRLRRKIDRYCSKGLID